MKKNISVLLPVLQRTVFLFTMICFAMVGKCAAIGTQEEEIQSEVAGLQLGLGEYTLATPLTAKQRKRGLLQSEEKSYQGTYKFKDGDFFVVVDHETDVVLALYKRIDSAERMQVKKMVAELMDRFGEPTAMAHEQMIYWVYSKNGKVRDELFKQAKKAGETDTLGIIASVKFSSSATLISSTSEVEGDKKMLNNIYYIITSDPLVKRFMVRNPE